MGVRSRFIREPFPSGSYAFFLSYNRFLQWIHETLLHVILSRLANVKIPPSEDQNHFLAQVKRII